MKFRVTSQNATPIPSEVLQHADVISDVGTHPLEPLAQDQNGRYGKKQDIWIDPTWACGKTAQPSLSSTSQARVTGLSRPRGRGRQCFILFFRPIRDC